MARYLYSELASRVQARLNCLNVKTATEQSNEWLDKHEETIERLVKQHMPSGSGFDSGTKIDFSASHADKLIFTTSFHHMDEHGYYDGWTDHTVTVTPSLQFKYHLRISGRNRDDIKEIIHEAFDVALSTDVTYDLHIEQYPEMKITSKWENADGSPSQCSQVFYAWDGSRFTSDSDILADGTVKTHTHYSGSPYERCRNYTAQKMEDRFYHR